SRPADLKEDILECNSVELSFALTRFVQEVRRPNGDAYSPDSIFYLCLGIQQYLFLQGRIENIFTDPLYGQFAGEITEMLRTWRPKFSPGGAVAASRVAESYLWECKQLGAYSPIVLLNTLLFFCTKHFGYTTLEQHRRLSFSNFTRCSKPCSRTGKSSYLLHRSSSTAPPRQETGTNYRERTKNPPFSFYMCFFGLVFRTSEETADGRGAGDASERGQRAPVSRQTLRVLPLQMPGVREEENRRVLPSARTERAHAQLPLVHVPAPGALHPGEHAHAHPGGQGGAGGSTQASVRRRRREFSLIPRVLRSR
ncbi:unnamed protein product, partial [Tetraodon nigroviridis]